MKKTALVLLTILVLCAFVSCDVIGGIINPDTNSGANNTGGNDNGDGNGGDNTPDEPGDEPADDPSDNPGEGEEEDQPKPEQDYNASLISVAAIKGLNEQIYLSINPTEGFSYKIYYKKYK